MRLFLVLFLVVTSLDAHAITRQIRNTTAPVWTPLPKFMVPLGAENLARGKPIKASSEPELGFLSQLNDGDKEGVEGHWFELGAGLQWVRFDLGRRSRVYGLHIWHYFGESNVVRDVIVQVADDDKFTKNVRTIYNNDQDNSSGLGKGTDREFYEHYHGFRIDTRGKNYEGLVTRFVRFYSNGNASDRKNRYTEIEIIGQPYNAQYPDFTLWKPILPQDAYYSGPRRPSRMERLGLKPLPDLWVPPGTRLLSKNKPVSSSDRIPTIGTLDMLTDGNKDSSGGFYIEVGAGTQWMQIDLLQPCTIYGLHLWHYFDQAHFYRAVVIQVADDADFTKNVRTLFNNDQENATGLGAGHDKAYRATFQGLLVDTGGPQKQGVTARFVRFYSSSNENNQYIEAEVIGLPAGQPKLKAWEFKSGDLGYMSASELNASGRIGQRYGKKVLPQPQQLKNFLVPPMARNLAWHKSVTFSIEPTVGDAAIPTDGDIEWYEGHWVELPPGPQWAQIDLGESCFVYAVRIVREYNTPRVFDDVIVQLADNADFVQNVRTLFNNDRDHSTALGVGQDGVFYENRHGLILDTRGPQVKTNLLVGNYKSLDFPAPSPLIGMQGRYLRFWSNGNTNDKNSNYVEIEVIGETVVSRTKNPISIETVAAPKTSQPQLKEWKTKFPLPTYTHHFIVPSRRIG